MLSTFYQQPFPIIELDDLYILREQTMEDTENFFRYYTDPEVGKYILASKPTTLLEASKEVQYCRNLFYSKQGIYWTIARKSDNQMIGAIGLYANNTHHRAEITYDLSREYWRKGITRKAIHAVVQYAFEKMKVSRVEAVTRHENTASIALLKNTGFNHEGTLKNFRYYNGRAWDIEMFAITSV
ncbi:MAG: N-acetyltransferase [Gammaproteobacteria bacterium CG_4_10_14_0_8_um_filter_38_16]|nr:MAG: N-acetyltransferase [Gammaproteobacteria bacterium CG_4_10_14_0_8_um_filter_38_16]PJA03609.1 MAG: N-acetyltransferase [Gammaproteobacteria bacterium CG_4_10_14_0_2_um_filter_38_22]PJB10460.1 MAG: N-acetyltransferase [Gammaproteobacteria bacterium CG_4_9_14_3_um_filter_38_9]